MSLNPIRGEILEPAVGVSASPFMLDGGVVYAGEPRGGGGGGEMRRDSRLSDFAN